MTNHLTESNTDYKQWALDMCVLLDRIEMINGIICHDKNIENLCQERFLLAEKQGLKVNFFGKTTGFDQ